MGIYGWVLLIGGLSTLVTSLLRLVVAGLLAQTLLGVGIWVGLTTLYAIGLIAVTRAMFGRWTHHQPPTVLSLGTGVAKPGLASQSRAA